MPANTLLPIELDPNALAHLDFAEFCDKLIEKLSDIKTQRFAWHDNKRDEQSKWVNGSRRRDFAHRDGNNASNCRRAPQIRGCGPWLLRWCHSRPQWLQSVRPNELRFDIARAAIPFLLWMTYLYLCFCELRTSMSGM